MEGGPEGVFNDEGTQKNPTVHMVLRGRGGV